MSTANDNPDSAEITLPQDDLATRKFLGQYELKRKLGQGGMGAVYLALDPGLKRQVALKILPREKASNPQLVKRFKAEAQNASQLTHENIVSVYGAGEADGYLYIALEFIDGIDVHDLVERRGVLPVKRSIDIIKQVCRALQHALEQGIVHRDIKPANLLVRRDGVVKLADMGLARAVDETMETSLTRAGTTVGTVDYMSPEQARNSKAADVRSDMYSLGCTWYHMLTGTPPYSEGSLTNKLNAHANRPPPDARDKNPAVTEGVVAVMQRMMAKEPGARYQTPLELIRDLEGALVNRDAVSRKILEAIDDEADRRDETAFETDLSSGEGSDAYPVNFQWSDSTVPVRPGAPTAVDDFDLQAQSMPGFEDLRPAEHAPEESASSWETSPPKATTGTAPSPTPHRGSTANTSGTKSPAPVTEAKPDSSGTLKSTPTPTPDHNKHQAAPNKGRHKQQPVVAAKPQPAAKAAPAPARNTPTTLPPPKRKGSDDPTDATAGSLPKPVKIALVALGIAAALGVIAFLASLAERLGGAVAPTSIAIPTETALPPPPMQAGNDPAAGQAVADAKNNVLTERHEQPDGKGNAGTPAAGANAGAAGGEKQAQLVPDWVDASVPSNKVPLLNVRAGASVAAERQFGSLVEALKNLPSAGARIVLSHDGPFDLTPVDIAGGLVILEAAPGTRPQIRVVADGEHHKLPWLNMTGGTLVLDGIDVIGDAAAIPVADPWTWVRVTGGHLQVRRSSFTLIGKRSGPTLAFRVTGPLTDKADKSVTLPRFLLDQSVVRGDGLQCVQLESPGFDGVVRNSLIIAGEAPAVAIRGADKAQPELLRQLRIVASTVCSNLQAVSLSAQGTTTPIQTELIALGALFAASAETHHPVLLALEEWPANAAGTENAGPYKNLNWTAAGCAVLGFNPLIKLQGNDAATVTDWSAWKKLWKEQSPTTFSLLAWPSEMKSAISATPLKAWSPKTLDSLALAFPVASVTPGCPVSDLRAPDFSTDAAATLLRPQRPRPPVPLAAKTLVQVDLVKTDLGKLIAGQDWEDGTVFVVSGSGQKYSSPIDVGRHKWRIQFRQTEGPTLVMLPRGAARSNDNSAFITIRGGQLDIEHGSFTFETKDTPSIPNWFLYAEGGSFTLKNCRIVMPLGVAHRNRGIIGWSLANAADKTASAGEFPDTGLLTDSLLIGNNTLISADMSRRALILNNSAFVARQHLFELKVGLNSGADHAAFDAQNCTFIAGGTQFSIKSQAAAGTTPLPCRMFQYNSVFAALPHDSHSKAAPLLMNYLGAIAAPQQIFWYEESCGYSPELKTYFASEMALPVTPLGSQDFGVDWTKRWGADHVQRPLHGADGVLFEKSLGPTAAAVRPENLTFHNTAKAGHWSETSGPIGARPQSLEPPPSPVKAAPGLKKAPAKSSSKVAF